jgi:surfactin synthase thioesterase subunit
MSVSTHAPTSRWLMRFHPNPDSAVRLVCFPHAGGAASYYHPLSMRFAADADVIALQYPGRQERRLEPCITDIDVLADRLTDELAALDDRPAAFFGHSMGAILAFETALRLERAGLPGPRALIVSGRRAPSTHRRETVHSRDDAGVIAELQRLGGTDVSVIDQELLLLAMPAIRGDYRAIESYRGAEDSQVPCPIVALAGDSDPLTTLDEVDAWGRHTTGCFRRVVFPGGHFFIADQRVPVQAEIARELAGFRAHNA